MEYSYKDFRETYAWTIKRYPSVTDMFRLGPDGKIGACVETHYAKIGNAWKETYSRSEVLTVRCYLNTIDAVPFFRSFGGAERIECHHTKYGKIPGQISSISPDKQSKTVRRFYF